MPHKLSDENVETAAATVATLNVHYIENCLVVYFVKAPTSSITNNLTIEYLVIPKEKMSAWGASLRSCDSLLDRLEHNDPTLEELVVLSTKTFGDVEIARIVKILESRNNSHWRRLSASGHVISNESLRRLGQAIGKQSTMTELAIGHAGMGDDGVCALCEGLSECDENPLTDLDLSHKGMGRVGLICVFETLDSHQIQTLNLSRNTNVCCCRLRLREEPAMDRRRLLFPQLKDLNMSECNLDDEFVEDLQCVKSQMELSLRLDNNPNITRLPVTWDNIITNLYLSGCQIGDKAFDGASTEQNADSSWWRCLSTLDLSNNALTATGAHALAALFDLSKPCSLCSLAELDLSRNQIGPLGVVSLCEAMKVCGKTFVSLDVSETSCGVTGAAAAVQDCTAHRVRLYGNNLGSEGFLALAQTLAQSSNPILVQLDLAGNAAPSHAVAEILKSLLSQDCHLETLVIGGNESSLEVESLIADVQRAHPRLDIARDKLKRPS